MKQIVRDYITGGALELVEGTEIDVENLAEFASNGATQVTITYPFQFMVLNPVVRLISPTSKTGEPLTLHAVALMRNEG